MRKVRNNKRGVESFVVAKRGTTIYAPVTNTHLTDSVTGSVVLADGQLGVFGASGALREKSLIAADTAVTANSIAIYQGTDQDTVLPYPLWTRPYEKTQEIIANSNIYATKQVYTAGTNSTWVIKNIAALSATTFGMNIGFRGRAAQEFFSAQEGAYLNIEYITPVYTSAQLLTTAPVTEIINNVTYEILRNSASLNASIRNRGGNWPISAFAVDTTGASGVLISGLVAGSVVPVMTTSTGIKSIKLNAEQAASLVASATAAGLAGTSTIIVANITTPVLADAIMVMGMDRQPIFKDYEVLNKTRLEVGLTNGFNPTTIYNTEVSFAKEPQGSGAQLAMKYKFTQGQRKYNLIDITDPVVEFANPFDVTETYDVIVIHHDETQAIDTHNVVVSPMREYICIPTNVKGIAGVSPLWTALVARLDSYFTSANQGVLLND
jgi:hypothetical protein